MNRSRLLALVLTVAATAGSTLSASAQTKPSLSPAGNAALAAVRQFIGAFNKGDMETAIATCAPKAAIIDEFPPHEWQGSNACGDWARDLAASNKLAGITNTVVTLGTPWRVDVTGTRAYVVAPARYDYRVHGKPRAETNSVFTVALARSGGVWHITGWAWSAR